MTDRMKHKRIRGRIRYTSKKPEMMGQVRGDEMPERAAVAAEDGGTS